MTHLADCKRSLKPHDPCAKCDCFEPDTDWFPEQPPCGGIATSINGGPMSEPPWCEVHMKPWGHRRPRTTTPRETDEMPEEGDQ